MRALHARLYGGVLAQMRHPTATYAPHVTVGAFTEHAAAERAAEALDVVNIPGKIDAVLIADFDGARHHAPPSPAGRAQAGMNFSARPLLQ